MNEENINKINETGIKLGIQRERNRILNEIKQKDLPLGVWPIIRNIICPEND